MRYYYKGKFRKGWTNITNCFRGTWVVGTPGSGKTFSIDVYKRQAWMIPEGDTAFSTRNFGEGVAQQAKMTATGAMGTVMR